MTAQHHCRMYYSISGEPFTIGEREGENIIHTDTLLNIYTKEKGEVVLEDRPATDQGMLTELSIPYPIRKDQFFNSETCCLFVDASGNVLHIGSHYLFPIHMMRHATDHERLLVRFAKHYFPGTHHWKKAAP